MAIMVPLWKHCMRSKGDVPTPELAHGGSLVHFGCCTSPSSPQALGFPQPCPYAEHTGGAHGLWGQKDEGQAPALPYTSPLIMQGVSPQCASVLASVKWGNGADSPLPHSTVGRIK